MADFNLDKKYNYNWQNSKFKDLAFSGSYISQFINDVGYVTSSTAVSASYATSASYAATASYLLGTITSASYAVTSSYSNYAETASSALNAQDILINVLNQSGYNIAKGVVVHITASGNSSDVPRIITASYENDNNSANTLGITNEAIANGSQGFVMTEGVLKGVNTQAFQSGQLVYLGATGSIIGTAPVAPLHSVRLGQVVRHQSNNGSIYVRIDNGYELEELHDVLIVSASSGNLLVRSGSVWINSRQLTGSYGLTGSLNATSFTGSLLGTASYASNALSASYVPSTPVFPYTGSALITGSLGVTGSSSILSTTTGTTKIFSIRNNTNIGDLFVVEAGGNVYSNGPALTSSNTVFGQQAGSTTTTGNSNTLVGYQAGYLTTTAANNTIVGYRAGGGVLASNLTGNNNTLVGSGAGLYLSSGLQNTFIGGNTGVSITTGGYNTIIGYYATSLAATTAQNVILSDGNSQVALWKNGSNLVGVGYNPVSDTLGAKFDVKAQGALSTDIALRVRNSANNKNIMEVRGDSETRWTGLTAVGNYVAIKNYTSYDANIDLMGGNSVKVQIYNDVDSNSNINKGLNLWNPGIVGSATAKINNIVKSGLAAYGEGYGFNWAFTSNASGIYTQAERAMWLTPYKSLVFYTGSSSPIDTFSEKTGSFEIFASSSTSTVGVVPHFKTERGTILWLGSESRLFNVTASNISASSVVSSFTGSLTGSVTNYETAWTSYTPVWTTDGVTQPVIGDGSITGAYKQIGKTVFVRVRLYYGTTTTSGTGTFYFSLPVTSSTTWGIQMPVSMLDNGNAWYQATANGEYGGFTTKTALIGQSAGGANSSQGVTGTFPFTFGNLDSIQFNGTYEST